MSKPKPKPKWDGGQAFPGPGPKYDDTGDLINAEFGTPNADKRIAEYCCKMADAMIAALDA